MVSEIDWVTVRNEPIKLSELARALKLINSAITVRMIRQWVDNGNLITSQNPLSKAGWHYVMPNHCSAFVLRTFKHEEATKVRECLIKLGLLEKGNG